jgi:hypothetical protein
MNPRRVHELMREHFPSVEHASRQWSLVQNERGPNIPAIAALLGEHIATSEVIVEVHRKLGALLPTAEAAAYIGAHIGQGEIRVANREFSRFVVVGVNGVATGWSHAG